MSSRGALEAVEGEKADCKANYRLSIGLGVVPYRQDQRSKLGTAMVVDYTGAAGEENVAETRTRCESGEALWTVLVVHYYHKVSASVVDK